MIKVSIILGTEENFLSVKNTHLKNYRFYGKIIKYLGENIGEKKLNHIGFGNDFLHQTLKTHAAKIKILVDKLDYVKMKSVLYIKKKDKGEKREPIKIGNKGLIKFFKKNNKNHQTAQSRNEQRKLKYDVFPK